MVDDGAAGALGAAGFGVVDLFLKRLPGLEIGLFPIVDALAGVGFAPSMLPRLGASLATAGWLGGVAPNSVDDWNGAFTALGWAALANAFEEFDMKVGALGATLGVSGLAAAPKPGKLGAGLASLGLAAAPNEKVGAGVGGLLSSFTSSNVLLGWNMEDREGAGEGAGSGALLTVPNNPLTTGSGAGALVTAPNRFLTAGCESFSLSDSPADLSVSCSVDLTTLSDWVKGCGVGTSAGLLCSGTFGAPNRDDCNGAAGVPNEGRGAAVEVFGAKMELVGAGVVLKMAPAVGVEIPNLIGVFGVQVLLVGAGLGSIFSGSAFFSTSFLTRSTAPRARTGWPSVPFCTRSNRLRPGVLSLASEDVLDGPVVRPLVNGAGLAVKRPLVGRDDGVSARPLAATLGS